MMNIWKTWFDAVLGGPDPELQRLRAENEMLKAQMEAIRMKRYFADNFDELMANVDEMNKAAFRAWTGKDGEK